MDNTTSTSGMPDKGVIAPNKKTAGKLGKSRKRRLPGFVKILLALVVIGAAAGGFYIWRAQTTAQAAVPQTITLPVTQGDLNITVETNGTVQASREASVKYETTGNVVEVLVKSGDKVEAGQELLTQTTTDQQAAVLSAQSALNTAQAKLDDLKKGPSASDLASAQADIKSAQAALTELKAGSSKTDIADAQADLRSAQANLASVKSGATAKEISDAEADVTAAQANYDNVKAGATPKEISDAEQDLKTAQAAYDALIAPPTQSAITEAQSNLDSAKAKLSALKAGPTAADLSTAQLAVTQAQGDLKTTQANDDLAKQEALLARDKADRDLQSAQLAYSILADQLLNSDGSLNVVQSDPKYTSYWTAYYAMQDAQDAQTQAAATYNNAVAKETQDINAAQAKLADAKTQLANVQSGAAASDIAAAEATVATSQKALDDLTAGPSKSDLATAQANVTKAQTALNDLKAGPTAADLAAAQQTLTKAQTALAELKAGPTAADVATAQTAVDKAQNNLSSLLAGSTADQIAAAEATVAQKQATLATLQEPASASDIAAAEQDVATAQNNLTTANQNLAKTVLKAPFSGTIGSVSAAANDVVSVGSEAMTIYDEAGMHVELAVNESDIQKMKVGESASITLDALTGQVFTGTVSSVSNVSTTSQNVVTYQVNVDFAPKGQPVKTGMSATATIIVESHSGVIEVPSRAITTKGPTKTVQVLYGQDQTPVTVTVTTGATNGTFTEITGCTDTGNQCLRAGDKVAITISSSTTTTTNTSNSGLPQFGGDFGGGQFTPPQGVGPGR